MNYKDDPIQILNKSQGSKIEAKNEITQAETNKMTRTNQFAQSLFASVNKIEEETFNIEPTDEDLDAFSFREPLPQG